MRVVKAAPVTVTTYAVVSALTLTWAVVSLHQTATAAEPVAGLELEIAGIRLLDPATAKPILSNVQPREAVGTGYYQLTNSSRTETITFILHPGSEKFSVAGVEVDADSPSPDVPEFPHSVQRFASARGVVLGMSRDEVKEHLGTPTSESDSEIRYFYDSEPWLKSFNFPAYESVYRFKDGKLVRFAFGFPYP